jgi:hypothetical protein
MTNKAAFAVVLLASSTVFGSQVHSWNLQTDYSKVNNPSGAWTYGHRNTIAGTTFTRFNANIDLNEFKGTRNLWYVAGGATSNLGVGKNMLATIVDGGQGTVIPAGEVYLHPGTASNNLNGIVRWTAPYDAPFEFQFALARFGGTLGAGTTTNGKTGFDLIVGGTSRYSQLVSGYPFGSTISRTYYLPAGSVVDFVASFGDGNNSFDALGLRANVIIVPEPTSLCLLMIPAAMLSRSAGRRVRA